MGSVATGIPTRAPVATSPFENSAISLSWSLKLMPEVEIKMEG